MGDGRNRDNSLPVAPDFSWVRPEHYWCLICNRGAEGCLHPIEAPKGSRT